MSLTASLQSTATASRVLHLPRGRRLELGKRTLLMGVLNLTPDSFSDGGRWIDPDQATEHGLAMIEAGADLLDLGAESTRPGGGVYGDGAAWVEPQEELDRLLPVIERLRQTTDIPLSIDTRKATVAQSALAAGGDLINDVSLLRDPELGRVAAHFGCPLILMHSRGETATMQREIRFHDLLGEIRDELSDAVDRALALGVHRSQLMVDPGLGFGKDYDQSLEILANPHFLEALDLPVLLGASRKSFIGHLTGEANPSDRLAGSLAAAGWAAEHAAAMVRVHDVADTARFLAVWRALAQARRGSRRDTRRERR